jgi:hypothetical protein
MFIKNNDTFAKGKDEFINSENFSLSRDEKDEEFAMDVMSTQLYSNPLRVICQEYMSNARDAHRACGKSDTPISVHLPSQEEPWFEVTDCGNGISPDDYSNIFLKYFASSKRGSVRENGGFGLGAKSAWSYEGANCEFFITTVYDGVEYEYHCYKNESRKRISELVTKSRIGRGETNGTKVRITINKNDINSFIGNFRDITLMWGVKPNVSYPSDFRYTSFGDSDILFENSGVTIFSHNVGASNNSTAIIDDIPYPIDIGILTNKLTDNEKNFIVNGCVYFNCDKLFVHPVPSRERLEYSNQTIEYLVQKIKNSYKDVNDYISAKIKSCGSYTESVIKIFGQELNISKLIKSKIVEPPSFNGFRIIGVDVNYERQYGKVKDRVSAYYANITDDGKILNIVDVNRHLILNNVPFVFQVGGMPSVKKLEFLVKQYSKNKTPINGINIVRFPDKISQNYNIVIDNLEKKYNWSQLNPIDAKDIKIARVTVDKSGKSFGDIYIIGDGKMSLVDVDFNGRYDIFIPIKNKNIVILGQEYGIQSHDFTNFKNFISMGSGVDFSLVNIYGIPKRFINKISKIKTMRSFDDVIHESEKELRVKYNFDDIYENKCNRLHIDNLIRQIPCSLKDIYKLLNKHGKIKESSILHKVCSLDVPEPLRYKMDTESIIFWYIKKIGNVKNSTQSMVETIAADVKKCREMYDTLCSITNSYYLSEDVKKINLFADIVDMIENKHNVV